MSTATCAGGLCLPLCLLSADNKKARVCVHSHRFVTSYRVSTQCSLDNSKLVFPSRPQFSTSQHNHLCRAQHRHAHRQRFHRHPSSAQRTPRGGDCVHQRPAALLHPEPHRSWHPPASLHWSTAIHRWEAGMLCLLRCISYLQCAVNAYGTITAR